MRKIVLTFGLISGAIMGVMFFVTVPFWHNGTINFDNGMVVGYVTMVIALSMIFFGVKSYRDNLSDGTITFGKGFKIGILITLVAAVIYALSWEVCYATMFTDFDEKMNAHYLESMKNEGITGDELKVAQEDLKANMEMYKNPLIRFAISMMEVFPVGIIITLITAALLRKKEILPAA